MPSIKKNALRHLELTLKSLAFVTLWKWLSMSTDSLPSGLFVYRTTASCRIIKNQAVWYRGLTGKSVTAAVNSTFPTTKLSEILSVLEQSCLLHNKRLMSVSIQRLYTNTTKYILYVELYCTGKSAPLFTSHCVCSHSGRMDGSHVGSL